MVCLVFFPDGEDRTLVARRRGRAHEPGFVPQLVTVWWLGMVPEDPLAGAEAETLARGGQPGLPPRFARVLGRQMAADEPVTA